MKILSTLLIIFFGISTLFSQGPTASSNTELTPKGEANPQQTSTQLYFLVKESFPLDKKGKHFLKNEFVEGTIIDFENESHHVPIRYRFLDDEMQIKHLGKVKALYPQRIKKVIFVIDDIQQTFIPITYIEKKIENLGFFEVKSSGKIMLLQAFRSEGKEGIKTQFFFKKEDSPAECFKIKKSKILKIFGKNKSKISKFIIKEQLNVKNENDLKRIFDYNNSLN